MALEAAPKSWLFQVTPSHPFLCVSGDLTLGVTVLLLCQQLADPCCHLPLFHCSPDALSIVLTLAKRLANEVKVAV